MDQNKQEREAKNDVQYVERDTVLDSDDVVVNERSLDKRVLFKLDILIIPLTVMLYVAASLDRGNAGNAKLQGLSKLLGTNVDTNYSIYLTAFYITYIVFNIPGNILGAVISPDKALAFGAITWGIASTAQAGAHSFGALVVCRLFIGIGEACFGTAVALYYNLWYKRNEIARRLSWYIGSGSLAGAFGGLIAYGVSFIHSKLATWRILFLIEGCPTILLAILVFLFLPSTPERSKYLKENERAAVIRRLVDTGVNRKHQFDTSALRRCFTTRTTYLNGVVYLSINMTLGSVSGFFPTIISSFGYTNARAQLFTVPPYAVAFVGTIIASYMSDRLRSRGIFVVILQLLSAVGFAILLGVPDNNAVRYFATFLAVLGCFSNGPLMLSWAANTAGSHSAAAVRLGFMNAMGQTFSILASFSFPSSQRPHYHRGFALNLAFNVMAAAVAGYLTVYYRRENAKRDREDAERQNVLRTAIEEHDDVTRAKGKEEGEIPEAKQLHDLTPGFRYYV